MHDRNMRQLLTAAWLWQNFGTTKLTKKCAREITKICSTHIIGIVPRNICLYIESQVWLCLDIVNRRSWVCSLRMCYTSVGLRGWAQVGESIVGKRFCRCRCVV